MKFAASIFAALLLSLAYATAALAQATVLQGGPWAPGRAPMYVGQSSFQPVIQDSGSAAGGPIGTGLSELGLTVRAPGTPPFANAGNGPFGSNLCDYDAPITNATGYHFICFSPNSLGGGLIAYGAAGAATPLPLQLDINGVIYSLPFILNGVVGPSTTVVGDFAIWNNTVGTVLKDVAQVTLAQLPTIAANSILMNGSGSSGVPGAIAMVACNATNSFLQYTTGSPGSFSCGIAALNQTIVGGAVITSGPVTVSSANCGATYALGGNAFYTVTVPSAGGFPIGCTIRLSNVDTFPVYNTTTHLTSGGRGKVLSGLSTPMLFPGQSIVITSLAGAGWLQPLGPERFQVNAGQFLRIFISTTGSDTNVDGLGGCSGSPYLTTTAAMNWALTNLDLRNSDPFTFQYCPGTYVAGSQAAHFPTVIPGRNGGAGVRFTGSPGTLQVCPDSSAVIIPAHTNPIIDGQLPYTWIQVDCMTMTTDGVAMISADRGSTVLLSTGLVLGSGVGTSQLQVANGATIAIDGSTTVTVTGGDDTGYFANIFNNGHFYSFGGTIAFDNGSPTGFTYVALFNLGQGATLNMGGAAITVNGSILGYQYVADGMSWVGSQIAIPGVNGILTNGSCVFGIVAKCAPVKATTTNNNAVAGTNGDYTTATRAEGSALGLTTATPVDVTGVFPLTAGDWDVWGNVGFSCASTTTITDFRAGISTTAATLPDLSHTGVVLGNSATLFNGFNVYTVTAPHRRISLAANTNVGLVAQADFGVSTCSAFGAIDARRASTPPP